VSQWSQLPRQWHRTVADRPDSVLLETSRFDASNQRSLLFLHPDRILSASEPGQMPDLFRQIEEAIAAGFHVAGFAGYECGYHFQSVRSAEIVSSELPLAWFGVYRDPLIFDHKTGQVKGDASLLSDSYHDSTPDSFTGHVSLTLSEERYSASIRRIKDYIAAGDTYQVNFTDSVAVETSLSAADAFTTLSRHQPIAYAAFLHAAGHHILSFSPELFFRINGDKITTRPMKGTMPRGLDSAEDIEAAARLQRDPKNRAEHVMIVDLLRNDLGRICTMGSIQVEDIFSVEKYRTLFQMTSTVSGTLLPGLAYYDIFKSLFPSGSVTGAPKIRTMEIIHELEQKPRGVYTGSIGTIAPDRSSVFNVAIRTLILKDGHARMGVGGGIVADSRPEDEYRECLLKANFLVSKRLDFQLIETMLWDGEDEEFARLALHLDRMQSSASYFDFSFDRAALTAQLRERSSQWPSGDSYRVRLLLDPTGRTEVTATKFLPGKSTGRVCFSSQRTFSGDVFLRHKTTRRERYDQLYRAARTDGFDEILFLNERDEVTEGAISNIFILRAGKLLTPPLCSGVLPGVFRRHLLETDTRTEEQILTLQDLESADKVFLCNSVQGLRQIKSLCFDASSHQQPAIR
jgi:para-aminobenzoate synthetase / 4-amino-4-deoxychorismate lyase